MHPERLRMPGEKHLGDYQKQILTSQVPLVIPLRNEEVIEKGKECVFTTCGPMFSYAKMLYTFRMRRSSEGSNGALLPETVTGSPPFLVFSNISHCGPSQLGKGRMAFQKVIKTFLSLYPCR